MITPFLYNHFNWLQLSHSSLAPKRIANQPWSTNPLFLPWINFTHKLTHTRTQTHLYPSPSSSLDYSKLYRFKYSTYYCCTRKIKPHLPKFFSSKEYHSLCVNAKDIHAIVPLLESFECVSRLSMIRKTVVAICNWPGLIGAEREKSDGRKKYVQFELKKR